MHCQAGLREEPGTFQRFNSELPREDVMIHLMNFTHCHLHTGLESNFDYQEPMTSPRSPPSGIPLLVGPAIPPHTPPPSL